METYTEAQRSFINTELGVADMTNDSAIAAGLCTFFETWADSPEFYELITEQSVVESLRTACRIANMLNLELPASVSSKLTVTSR